jgi:hypothetical protein
MRVYVVLGALLALTACGTKSLELGGSASCGDAGDGKPVVIASGQPNPNAIAVDSTSIYWTNSGSSTAGGDVMSAPLCGGTPVTIAPPVMLGPTTEANPSALVANASSVFWIVTNGNGYILSAPIGGGSTSTLATDQYAPFALAIDASNVYWLEDGSIDGGSGAVVKVSLTGGTPTTLARPEFPSDIAVDTDNVYFSANNGVFSVPIAGGATTTIAGLTDGADGIAVDAANVYWTIYNQRSSSLIMKAPKSGGAAVTLVGTGVTNPGRIVSDGTYLYWTDAGPCGPRCMNVTGEGMGKIGRVPVGGGPVVTLATEQAGPLGLFVDATSVYWTTQGSFGDGSIVKLTPK